MKSKKLIFFQLLNLSIGVTSLSLGFFISIVWVNYLIINPRGKMILDWQYYVPMAMISSCIFIVIGAYVTNKIWRTSFWKIVFQWSNAILILGCIGLILALTQIQDFFTELDAFLWGLTVSLIPLIILVVSLKLRCFGKNLYK
jgi:hypothetical protein